MTEHKIPIPSRIYNAAVGGHVAGADQIIDDKTGLTLDKVAGGALEEKEYTSGSNNGMGRVILRKNIVEGVNTLTQSMINKNNTIYVIQYDFTLGENITIPENCILEFDGGSISGTYTITGNNTEINARLVKIFNTDVTIDGFWNVTEAYPEWFGAKGDQTFDDTKYIQKAINSFSVIKFVSEKGYNITANNEGVCLILKDGSILVGSKCRFNRSKINPTFKVNSEHCIGILGKSKNTISNISLLLNATELTINDSYTSIGIKLLGSNNYITNTDVISAHIGFESESFLTTIINCNVWACKVGFYCHGITSNKWYENGGTVNINMTSNTLLNCYAVSCTKEAYIFQGMSYSSIISCAADGCGIPVESIAVTTQEELHYPYYIIYCKGMSITNCGSELSPLCLYIKRSASISVDGEVAILGLRIKDDSNVKPHSIISVTYSSGIHLQNIIIQKNDTIDLYSEDSILIYSSAYITVEFANTMGTTLGTNLLTSKRNMSNWGNATSYINIIPMYNMKGTKDNLPSAFSLSPGEIYMLTENDTIKPVFNVGSKWVDATGATV